MPDDAARQSGYWACRLDGRGGARTLAAVPDREPTADPLWIHVTRTSPHARSLLSETLGLDPLVVDALVVAETRPRALGLGHGLLVTLRGVNFNPGEDLEDMVAVRMWLERNRIVTSSGRIVRAITDAQEALALGRGPHGPGDFLTDIVLRVTDRLVPLLEDLDERTDALEDRVTEEPSRELRTEVSDVRRAAIMLRRHLAPQRQATSRLQAERADWLTARHRARLREAAERTLRYVEDLDEVRERATVMQDEIMNRLSEQMNRNMYVLSVMAAIMLPLTLVTGLLGINVAGIPGAESPRAFAIVTGLLVALGGALLWVFRRRHWL